MPPPNQITTRTFKAGEIILKPTDKPQGILILQSGCVSLCHVKNGKLIEVTKLRSPACIGDEVAFAPSPWNLSALALRDVTVVEVPLIAIKEQLIRVSPLQKMLLKALSDTSKFSFADLRNQKLNREVLPCPPEVISKMFGVIFHTARILAEQNGQDASNSVTVSWTEFKKYALEVFEEPTHRLEDGIGILLRLGYARLSETELSISEMKQIEAFFEYYGRSFFTSGNRDFLKTDAKSTKVTEEFLRVAEKYPADRAGFAHLPFKITMDLMKTALGKNFESDQLFRLEQKGLFIKRTANAEGGILSFYKPDFEQMLLNWKILRELELWNENGFVNLSSLKDLTITTGGAGAAAGSAEVDYEAERKKFAAFFANWKPVASSGKAPVIRTGEKKAGEIWCTVCMSVVQKEWKTCEVCGNSLKEAA